MHPLYNWLKDMKGWNKLVTECQEELSAIDPYFTIIVAQEKFGMLDLYYTYSPASFTNCSQYDIYNYIAHDFCQKGPRWKVNAVNNVIERYKFLSTHICEYCGEAGEIKYNHTWIKTLCDKHWEQYQNGKLVWD